MTQEKVSPKKPLSEQPKTRFCFDVRTNNENGPSWQAITLTDSARNAHPAGDHYAPPTLENQFAYISTGT